MAAALSLSCSCCSAGGGEFGCSRFTFQCGQNQEKQSYIARLNLEYVHMHKVPCYLNDATIGRIAAVVTFIVASREVLAVH